jgi:hypothetical protein
VAEFEYSPDVLAVRKLDWDFFVTLTHKKGGFSRDAEGEKVFTGGRWESPSKSRQKIRYQCWIYRVCKSFKIKPRNFEWVGRLEKGGKGGRDHFHVLLRLNKRHLRNSRSCVFRLIALWKGLDYGGANVRAVKASDGIAGYIAKVVSHYEESRFCEEQYRSVKFSSAALRAMKAS